MQQTRIQSAWSQCISMTAEVHVLGAVRFMGTGSCEAELTEIFRWPRAYVPTTTTFLCNQIMPVRPRTHFITVHNSHFWIGKTAEPQVKTSCLCQCAEQKIILITIELGQAIAGGSRHLICAAWPKHNSTIKAEGNSNNRFYVSNDRSVWVCICGANKQETDANFLCETETKADELIFIYHNTKSWFIHF